MAVTMAVAVVVATAAAAAAAACMSLCHGCVQIDLEDKAKTAKITSEKAVADKQATLLRKLYIAHACACGRECAC